MADKTGIEWTDATWNPVTGCAKVSQGCKHCYAEREWPRMTKLVPAYAGRDFTDVRTHADRLDQPIRWAKRRMIFVNSMSDLFHPAVPDDFIDSVFGVMWACLYGRNEQDGHIFQVLTKRADRMRDYFRTDRREAWARSAVHHGGGSDPDGIWDQLMDAEGPHPRIWLGVSVEDQATADGRIPLLLDTPAAVRWISAEPLLGPVDLRHLNDGKEVNEIDSLKPWTWEQEIDNWRGTSETWEDDFSDYYGGLEVKDAKGLCHNRIDWVVVGGESGPKARPMKHEWARSLRDQCEAAGVPFLFKQWGEWAPNWLNDDAGQKIAGSEWMDKMGKKSAGRLLDGVQHDGYPEVTA